MRLSVMKLSVKGFFSKCEQVLNRKLHILLHNVHQASNKCLTLLSAVLYHVQIKRSPLISAKPKNEACTRNLTVI